MNLLAFYIANQIPVTIALLSCEPCGSDVQHALRNSPNEANTRFLCALNTHIRGFTYIHPHNSAQPELALACFHSFSWTQGPSFKGQHD
jgi:hypothetical protein